MVCDAIDYCNYGFRLRVLNRIWYRIPAISQPFLKATNGEIINDFRSLKNYPRSFGGGNFAYITIDDNGFHMLERYRLW